MPPRSSIQIPSVIYFEDLRVADYPRVLVGDDARLEILKNPSRVYAYCESIKRLLGSNKKMTILDAPGAQRVASERERQNCRDG